MALAQKGDQDAYHRLLVEVKKEVMGYLTKRVFKTEDVDDVFQNILLSVHKSRHTFLVGKAFRPWLYAIVGHRLVDYYRKVCITNARETVSDQALALIAADVPKKRFIEGTELEPHFFKLSEKQQKILKLHAVDGFTYSEISVKLNMTLSAVKVSAHRGFKMLKKHMVPHV